MALQAGTRVWGGRLVLHDLIHGDWSFGLVRARDEAGKAYLVAVGFGDMMEKCRHELVALVRGVAPPVAFTREGELALLIEAEPPGLPSDEVAPLRPADAIAGAIAVARFLDGLTQAVYVRPEAIYVQDARVSAPGMHWPLVLFLHSREPRFQTPSGSFITLHPRFMSPEQARAVLVGPPADVFTLGMTLAFWLTGQSPFLEEESLMATLAAILLQKRRPVPRRTAVWDVIDAMLAADPAARPKAAEVVARLAALDPDEAPFGRAQDPVVRARLIADVVAAPDDDEPRLVLGDWLSEHGDPRGELILVQCRLAHEDDPTLRAREAELVSVCENDLTAHLFPWVTAWTLARGFVATIDCSFRDYANRIQRLREAGPLPKLVRPSLVWSPDGRSVLEAIGSYVSVFDVASLRAYQIPHHVARGARFEERGRVVCLEPWDGGPVVRHRLDEIPLG